MRIMAKRECKLSYRFVEKIANAVSIDFLVDVTQVNSCI